jgi:hypothetical protein
LLLREIWGPQNEVATLVWTFSANWKTAIFDQEGFEKYKPKKFVELVEGFVEYQYPT